MSRVWRAAAYDVWHARVGLQLLLAPLAAPDVVVLLLLLLSTTLRMRPSAAARAVRTPMRIFPIVIADVFVVRMTARSVTAGRAVVMVVLVTAVSMTARAVLTGVAATVGRWLWW